MPPGNIACERTVSVILPVYNCRPLLERTLAGLKCQSYPADLMEVLVADDGSSDGVSDLIRESRTPWRLSLVRQEDLGYRLSASRNRAIRAASGEVIIALDGDMLPVRDFVASHMRWFHRSDRVATIGLRRFADVSGVVPLDIEEGRVEVECLREVESASNSAYPLERRLRELRNFDAHPAPYSLFHGCNVAYRRDAALAVGLYDEEFDGHWGYEDIEFGFRLWKHGLHFVDERGALAWHQEDGPPRITAEERRRDSAVNFEIACRKMPEWVEFRKSLAEAKMVPWWM